MAYYLAENPIHNIVLDFDQTMYPNTHRLRAKQKRLIGKNLVINILSRENKPPTPKNIRKLEQQYHKLAKVSGHSNAFVQIGGNINDYLHIIRSTEQSPLLKPDEKLISMLQLMKENANIFVFTGSHFGPVSRALNILLDGNTNSLIKQVVASDTLPYAKPNQEAYLAMRNVLDIEPSNSVMVDDRIIEINAARSIGMMGILVGRQHSCEVKAQANASISTIHSLIRVLALV